MAVIREARVHGVSARAVDDPVRAMGGTGASKSEVSRLCAEIGERVQAFPTRLLEGAWPCPWLAPPASASATVAALSAGR